VIVILFAIDVHLELLEQIDLESTHPDKKPARSQRADHKMYAGALGINDHGPVPIREPGRAT